MFRARVETGSTAGLSSVGNSVAKSFRKVGYRSLSKTSLYLLITPCTVLSENYWVSLPAQRRAAALSVVLSGFGLSAFLCALFPRPVVHSKDADAAMFGEIREKC